MRWQVELFFKWIKQHLRIKRFFGTSENAVKTQVWIAVAVYVLVAIIRKRLDLEFSLHECYRSSALHHSRKFLCFSCLPKGVGRKIPANPKQLILL